MECGWARDVRANVNAKEAPRDENTAQACKAGPRRGVLWMCDHRTREPESL